MTTYGQSWIDVVNARGVADVARRLGLEFGQRGPGSVFVSPCPACGAVHRHESRKDKRGAVGLTPDGLGWRCFACGEGGNAVILASWKLFGKSKPPTWQALRERLASYGAILPGPSSRPKPQLVTTVRALKRPQSAEALWNASFRLDAVPSHLDPSWTGNARKYLASERKLNVGLLSDADSVRILPPNEGYPWPEWWPGEWSSTNRLVMPMYESNGTLGSLHARAISPTKIKTRSPKGCQVAELVFADAAGVQLLSGAPPTGLECVVITEGFIDSLKMMQLTRQLNMPWAVLGVISGSIPAFGRIVWPPGITVRIGTHNDDAGEKYALGIAALLPPSVNVQRIFWDGKEEQS